MRVFLCLFLLIACKQVNPRDLEQESLKVVTLLENDSRALVSQTSYSKENDLEAMYTKCSESQICNTEEIEEWISMVPPPEYFQGLAVVEDQLLEKLDKTKASTMSPYLLNVSRKTLALTVRTRALLNSVHIHRILVYNIRWDNELINKLRSKTLDFLCSDLRGAAVSMSKLTTIGNPNFPKVLPVKLDPKKFDARYKSYKELSSDYLKDAYECPWWKNLFGNSCLERHKALLDKNWNEGEVLGAEINKEVKDAYCE
jgi:hypothetical protein